MSERLLKFRTPTNCQNGHFRWYYFTASFGRCTSSWGPKNCDCPTGEFHQGFQMIGPDEQCTDFEDKAGREIWEGDLLFYPVGIQLRDERAWPHREWLVTAQERRIEVVWENGCWRLLDYCRHTTILMSIASLKEMTVVGNLYEEPRVISNDESKNRRRRSQAPSNRA